MTNQPVPAVGVVVLRGEEVLLVRRGSPPRLGQWSLPGGRIEWGETAQAAAIRELTEETGVEAELLGLVEVVDAIFTSRTTGEVTRRYVLSDFAARWVSGEPVAGDDAAEARFVHHGEVASLVEWSETVRIIEKARALWA
ncbi:MAG TPA: NUDIX hydrolase [Caulobacteraceae bacterium]